MTDIDRIETRLVELTHAVSRIGDLLDALMPLLVPEQARVVEPDAACTHPEDTRIELGGQGTEEWVCGLCQHHYGPVRMELAHV